MKDRVLSALEFLIGAGIVFGHNVFHVLPNEVPILALLGLVSVRLREGGWSAMGYRRPASWRRIVVIALGAAALRLALGALVIEPVASRFWPPAHAPAGASDIPGNLLNACLALLLVWGFAAFGEETGYRGYLLKRAADALGGSTAAYGVGVVLVSILFGYGHYFKGPAGIVDSGVAGLILGCVFLATGRNLWACILTHGFIDTVAVVAVYFGLNS
jgi:membrane protease YdiL (CAAX protease family)